MAEARIDTAFDCVEARQVTKIFDRQRALSKIDLRLEQGKLTAILGPNGAGKSTLLWLFSTLSRPTSGSMHFGALPPERAKEARGRIGLLSHAPQSYGDLTGLENVTFFAKLHRRPSPEREAAEILADLGLEEAMRRPAKTYSRGMIQRLGLARTLVGRPSLLLLDEPFTGLDQNSAQTLIERILLLKKDGVITLMVSHDLGVTAHVADDVLILVRGKGAARLFGGFSAEGLRSAYARATEKSGVDKTASEAADAEKAGLGKPAGAP